MCGSTPSPAPDPYLCYTFWVSTPSPAPVPSMFPIRLCGGNQLQFWLQLQIYICVVPFEYPLHHQLHFHVHFTLDYVGGINSMSGSNSRSIFVLHLWRSTPSPPQVPSMFHIRLCWGQFQTQHNICFVPFEHPLHLQLQSHICFTLDYGGVNFISSSRSIFVLYLLRVLSISISSPIYVSA